MLLTSPVTFSSTPVAVLYPMTAVAEPPQRSRINPLLDAVMTAGGELQPMKYDATVVSTLKRGAPAPQCEPIGVVALGDRTTHTLDVGDGRGDVGRRPGLREQQSLVALIGLVTGQAGRIGVRGPGRDRIVRRRAVHRRPCARRTTDAVEPGRLHEEGVCGVVFARRHGEAARSERDAGAKKNNRERGEERSDFH